MLGVAACHAWPLLGRSHKEAQGARANQQRGTLLRPEAECTPYGIRLHTRQRVQPLGHRPQQLVQPRVHELRLSLNAVSVQHAMSFARERASASNALFPIPGSPLSTSAPPRPSRAPDSSASIRARSVPRPTSMPQHHTAAIVPRKNRTMSVDSVGYRWTTSNPKRSARRSATRER